MILRLVALALTISVPFGAALAQTLDRALLTQIDEFATEFCDQFGYEGSRTSVGGGVEAQAKLDNFVGRLLGATVTGRIDLDTERYTGIPQDQVAQDRQRHTNCKLDLWQDLRGAVLGAAIGSGRVSELEGADAGGLCPTAIGKMGGWIGGPTIGMVSSLRSPQESFGTLPLGVRIPGSQSFEKAFGVTIPDRSVNSDVLRRANSTSGTAFRELDWRPLKAEELAGCADEWLQFMRSELLARHGFEFQCQLGSTTCVLESYFEEKDWFEPKWSAPRAEQAISQLRSKLAGAPENGHAVANLDRIETELARRYPEPSRTHGGAINALQNIRP